MARTPRASAACGTAAASERVDETEAARVRAKGDDAKQVRVRAARQDVDLAAKLGLDAHKLRSTPPWRANPSLADGGAQTPV